jgi:hypothetical protein
MTQGLEHLAIRIRNELSELEHTIKRATEGLALSKQTGDDHYLDGVALNLHSFYSGIERIFELVATHVDGTRPEGKNWHQILLKQMAEEIFEIRPAVISDPTRKSLDEYRGFRHVVRNVYAYKFDSVRVEKLVERVSPLFSQLQAELLAFSDFLERGNNP